MFVLFNRNSLGLSSRRFVRFNPGPSNPNRSFAPRSLKLDPYNHGLSSRKSARFSLNNRDRRHNPYLSRVRSKWNGLLRNPDPLLNHSHGQHRSPNRGQHLKNNQDLSSNARVDVLSRRIGIARPSSTTKRRRPASCGSSCSNRREFHYFVDETVSSSQVWPQSSHRH